MVYITDDEGTVKKFACLTCIKGHRSSGCQHADRELVEIRKKGRPLTQCAHCRNLRKTKQVHIKCLCHKKSDVLSSLSPPSSSIITTTTTTTPPASATAATRVAPTSAVTAAAPSSTTTASENQYIDLTQQDLRVQNLLSKPCARCDRSPSYCICTFESRSNQADYGYLSSGSSDGTVTPPTTTAASYSNLDLHHNHHHHSNAISSSSTSSSSSSPTSTSIPTTTNTTTTSTSTTGHSLRLVIPSNNPISESTLHHHRPPPATTYDQHSESSSAASSRHGSPFTSTSCYSSSTKASPSHQSSHRPSSISSPAGLHSIIPIHDPSDDLDSDTPIYKSEEQAIDQSAVLGELTNRTSEELMNQIYNEFSAQTYRLSHPPLMDFVTDEPEDEHHHHHNHNHNHNHNHSTVLSRTSSTPSASNHQHHHQSQLYHYPPSSSASSSSTLSPMPPASPLS